MKVPSNYQISLSTELLDEYEVKDFVLTLYKLGFSVYRGLDNEICFTVTDEEVIKINEE